MRWIAVIGWALAAMFGLLWISSGPCGGPVLRDPEADLLRDRIRELEADREAADHPPLVRPGEEPPAPPPPSRFTVKVVSASGLPDMDSLGKADPFVVVAYDGEERLTPVESGTVEPIWGQTFEFRYVEGQRLTLTILDRDVMSHDLVGRVDCSPDPEAQGRVELSLSGGGTITVEIRFSP